MDEIKKKEIQDVLVARGALLPCARCGRQAFTVLDGYATVDQQNDLTQLILGGATVPCAVIGCNNCGNISLHALGPLGLFKPPPPEPPPERRAQ